jgi:hypothetical protein
VDVEEAAVEATTNRTRLPAIPRPELFLSHPAVLLLVLAAACGGGSASNVGPGNGECLRDDDCNDRVDCTDDVCGVSVNGVRRCEHVPRTDRCAAGSECLAESALGAGCIERVALWCAGRGEGVACTPDDACAQGGGACQNGRCTYARTECAPAVCLESRGCSASTGRCEYGPQPDGTACDTDGLACSSEECTDGQCGVRATTCQCAQKQDCPPVSDKCHVAPRCVNGACVYDPVECPTAESCKQFVCDPADGECVGQPIHEGEPCDDHLACTQDDACHGGRCYGGARDCQPGSCRTSSCAEPAGCAYVSRPDDGSCDDGDPCNGPDACLGGVCRVVGPALDCDDGDPCTADACRPLDGVCVHAYVPNCCGNGVPELTERCDPGPAPSPLCRSCGYAVADLTDMGSAPAVAWSPAGRQGLLAWEESRDGSMILKVRPLDASGRMGEPVPLPGIAPGSHGRFHPALGTLSEGRFLLAFYTGDGVALRLLGPGGAVLGQAEIPEAIEEDEIPGSELVIGTMNGVALLAWQVLHEVSGNEFGQVRAAWVITANDSLLSAEPVTLSGDPAAYESSRLGTICMGADGALVTLTFRGGSHTRQQAVYHGTDGKVLVPQVLADYSDELPMAPCCATTPAGTFLAAALRPVTTGELHGLDVSITALDATGVPTGTPWSLVQSLIVPKAYMDLVYPVFSSLDRWGDGYLFVTTWARGVSMNTTDSLSLQAVATSGVPGSAGLPLPVEGASDGFTVGLDVTAGPDGAILMGWHRQEVLDIQGAPGVVRARFLAPP